MTMCLKLTLCARCKWSFVSFQTHANQAACQQSKACTAHIEAQTVSASAEQQHELNAAVSVRHCVTEKLPACVQMGACFGVQGQ